MEKWLIENALELVVLVGGGVFFFFKLQNAQDATKQALTDCQESHIGCPKEILSQVETILSARFDGLTAQVGDCQRRLGNLEAHLMNGIHK